MTEIWVYSPEAGADFQTEYCWKSWDDYPAVRELIEEREYTFDAACFRNWVERLGGDGVAMLTITQSPLKTFYWLAGGESTHYFVRDHPEEMRELAAIHVEKALGLLSSVVDLPEAEIFLSLDNLDASFYPPSYYAEFCDPFFSRAAEMIHSRGKIFVVHACGRNRRLLPLVGRSRVDCLEGITPAPLGDVDLSRARQMTGWEAFTVNGGIDSMLLGGTNGVETKIHDYTRRLFASMGDQRHFIYASSCSTPVRAPWENLKYFRDAAREYGPTDQCAMLSAGRSL